jgi:PKHD-type hydroxylase
MYAHWCNLKAFLSPYECLKLIMHAKLNYQPQNAVVGHGGQAKQSEIRSSVVRWLDYEDLDLLWFFRKLDKAVLRANRELFGYNLQHSSTELQFTEYHGSQEGHYDWHEDNSAQMKWPMDRKLSFVIQLSDPKDYKGGAFELHGDPLPEDAYTKQGDALIFRSCLRHRVLPVTEGVRMSFVTWYHGPRA